MAASVDDRTLEASEQSSSLVHSRANKIQDNLIDTESIPGVKARSDGARRLSQRYLDKHAQWKLA